MLSKVEAKVPSQAPQAGPPAAGSEISTNTEFVFYYPCVAPTFSFKRNKEIIIKTIIIIVIVMITKWL